MKLELTEKEAEDLKQGLVIAMHASNHERTKIFCDRLEAITNKLDDARDGRISAIDRTEKRSLTEKVLCMYVGRYLEPTLTAGEMITVFDLIEHNDDGRSRLKRLIEEKCTRELNAEEMEEAAKLLEDYLPEEAEDANK